MISLNEAYANDTLYYWCNSCGEINYPGSGINSFISMENHMQTGTWLCM